MSAMCRQFVFRNLWNGVPTSWRMREIPGTQVQQCAFGYGSGVDRIEHYLLCAIVWRALPHMLPSGISIDTRFRSIPHVMLLEDKCSADTVIQLGILHFSVSHTLLALKPTLCTRSHSKQNVQALLRLFGHEAAHLCKV